MSANSHSIKDPAKVECEKQFYGFSLDDFKKDFDKSFRLHCNKIITELADNIIDGAQKELTVETAAKLKDVAENSLQSVKPDLIKFLSKIHSVTEKYLSIPDYVPLISDACEITPTPDQDIKEKNAKSKIAELEMVYKQQAVMMNRLYMEKQLYDRTLSEEAENDSDLCDIFESSLHEINFDTEVADKLLKELELKEKANEMKNSNE